MSHRFETSLYDQVSRGRQGGPSHSRSVSRASTAFPEDDAPPTESLRQRNISKSLMRPDQGPAETGNAGNGQIQARQESRRNGDAQDTSEPNSLQA